MKSIFSTAWHRFGIISSIISDTNARAIAVFFYFTFLMPFGIGSALFTDPLHIKEKPQWLDRHAVPNDLESAREQG